MKRILLVVFLCLAVVAFFGCKKDEKKEVKTEDTKTEVKTSSDEDQIIELANKYFECIKKGDAATLKTLLDEKSLEIFDAETEKYFVEYAKKLEQQGGQIGFVIKNIVVTGDTAELDFNMTTKVPDWEESHDDARMLVKVNGGWKFSSEKPPLLKDN